LTRLERRTYVHPVTFDRWMPKQFRDPVVTLPTQGADDRVIASAAG